MKEESMSAQDLVSKEVLSLTPLKEHQQHEVTMIRTNKNKNGKRNPETQITGKKARKLSKKKGKLEKLQEVPKKTSQETHLQNLNPTRIAEQHRMGLFHGESI
jgi:hypothetical protein